MPNEARATTPRNVRKTQPSVEAPNEWTDGTGPPRLMKMPKAPSVYAMLMSAMFHIRNMPRRFCTMMEWMKAVSASHGMNAAFSTGSHAQYPPQPRIV